MQLTGRLIILFVLVTLGLKSQVTADFSANVTEGCAPLIVKFTNKSIGSTSWDWSFGFDQTSSLENPTIVFSQPGLYTVTLKSINGNNSDTKSETNFIRVNAPPVADFNVDDPDGCSPHVANFLSLSVPQSGAITDWFWSFGNGDVSNDENPSTNFTETKKYPIYLKVIDVNGCEASIIKNDFIQVEGPIAQFNIDSVVCSIPATVPITNGSISTDYDFLWDFGDGSTSTSASPLNHAFSTYDTFAVKLLVTARQTGCSDSVTHNVYIQKYEPKFDYTVSCTDSNYTVILEDKTIPKSITNKWEMGDGTTLFDNTVIIHTYKSLIEHEITLTSTIDESCIGDTSVSYQPPYANFSFPNTGCLPPFHVNFENKSQGIGLSSKWKFDEDPFIAAENPSYTFNTPPTNHFVTLEVTDTFNCVSTFNNNVEPPFPIADFHTKDSVFRGCAPLEVTFLDSSYRQGDSTIAIYNWSIYESISKTLVFTSSDSTPTFNFTTPGDYTVEYYMETEQGCSDTKIDSAKIKVGIDPNVADFNLSPANVCFGETVSFSSLETYSNPIYSSNYWCWAYEEDGNPLLVDKETLPPDCRLSLSQSNNPYAKYQTKESTSHSYSNYEFGKQDTSNGKIYLSDVTPNASNMFAHLIVGYNGCYKEVAKPVDIESTIAMPGYIFSDSDSVSLFSCNKPKEIGFFNDSKNYDIFNYLKIIKDGNPVLSINEFDTVFYDFSSPGKYSISISVENSINGCKDSTFRTFVQENPNLEFEVRSLACKEKELILFDDESSSFYSTSSIKGRNWIVNDTLLYTAVDDSSKLPFSDTGRYDIDFLLTLASGHDQIFSERKSRAYCTAKLDSFIYVNGIVFHAWSDSLFYCGGETVAFNDTSGARGTIDYRRWDFDLDSVFSSKMDTNIIYYETDLHKVKLVLGTDFGCLDSIYLPLIKVNKPVADFISHDTTLCVNAAQTFNNLSSGSSLTYSWGIENQVYTNRDIAHQFNNLGKIDVKLTVFDDSLCVDSITKPDYMRVVGKQTTLFEADTHFINCPPLAVQFTDTSNDVLIKKWFWEFGDGQNSQQQNPLHVYSRPGKFDVKLITFNEAECPDTLIQTKYITVNGPNGSASIDNLFLCLPDTSEFSVTLNNTLFYIWDFGDGSVNSYDENIDGLQIKYDYKEGGVFQPKLDLIDSNGCFYTLPQLDFITADSIDARVINADTIQCDINNVKFNNNSRYSFDNSFIWHFGDGDSSLEESPIHSFLSSGTYQVKLFMKNKFSCEDTLIQNFTISEAPEASLTIEGDNFCIPSETQIKVNILNNSFIPDSIFIQSNGISSVFDSLSQLYDEAKNYPSSYSIFYGKGTCKVDSNFNLTYYEYPVAAFSSNANNNSLESPSIEFYNSSSNSSNYNWDFGDGNTSNIENPGHGYDFAGDYTIKLIVGNDGGCYDTTTSSIPIAPFDFIKLPSAFSPNGDGVNDNFGILHAGEIEVTQFRIYNRWGNKVFETTNQEEKWDGKYKNRNQDAGTYVYYVTGVNQNNIEVEIKGNFTLIK